MRPSNRRPFIAATLGAALCLAAAAPSRAASAELSADQARSWIGRIHDAAIQRNYQGTLVYSAAGVGSSTRVAHYCEGPQQYERIESLDGEMRRVYRHNEVVQTVWPSTRSVLVEQRDPRASFPSLPQPTGERLVEHYELREAGVDRVAGHEVQVLELKPRDAWRYGQRLWADKATGLLLRADTLGPKDEALESSWFSEVSIGVKPQPETVLQPMKRLDGLRIVRTATHPTQLDREGWALKPSVPGFRQISCVKRPLEGADGQLDRGGIEVLQAIYSDGLTHVSVFIEPFNAERHRTAMHTAIGATQTLMRQQGEHWVTVVGDVPLATLKAFASALERRPAGK